jgi:hypothetical protein
MADLRFTINMTCENAAFEDNPQGEVSRILRRIADFLEFNNIEPTWHTILDINGNDVGRWKLGEDR